MKSDRSVLRKAVVDAVSLVNTHSGQAAVTLRYNADDYPVDFVANSGAFQGDKFVFTAGFEQYAGTLDQLADIRAELIAS